MESTYSFLINFITVFIAEHGPECLQEKQEAIQQCVNKTLGSSIKFDQTNLTSFSADSFPKLQFGVSFLFVTLS